MTKLSQLDSRMTTAISISEKADEIWTIQDSIFEWFASLIAERYRDEPEVVAQVELASAMNGVSLDVLSADNPELSNRLAGILRSMAQDVVDGEIEVPEEVCESADRCRALFSNLIQILSAFENVRSTG
ncbi:hypothetical protein [Allorhodopirellula solitaria]|uniref:hypothetical protein n=1 Tax=Allorhodopirellula solitaria TaxID=2527987 RepID=UPI0011B4BEFC|nr:hypothetical protein [Allorhodopirellula solitaria]